MWPALAKRSARRSIRNIYWSTCLFGSLPDDSQPESRRSFLLATTSCAPFDKSSFSVASSPGCALEGDGAMIRMIETVDDVKHRGFAGAVRADDGAYFALSDVERNVPQRPDATEGALRRRPEAGLRLCPALSCGLPQGFRRTHCLHVADLDPRCDRALAAILKSDLSGNIGFMRAVVERRD